MKRAVLLLISGQYLMALLIEAWTGFRYTPSFKAYFGAATAFAIFILGGACIVRLAMLAWRKADQPAGEVISYLRGSGDVIFIYYAVAAQLCVLSWLKVAMPHSVGFRSDKLLADLDAAIFGIDPWRLVQWVPSLDRPYLTWISTTLLVMIVLPLLAKSSKRDAAIVSYFLVVAFAAIGQYLLPSAGPVFYERIGLGDKFADLPIKPWVQAASDYLWVNHVSQGQNVGTGISAFPSLHVAGAAWVALVVSSFSPRLWLPAWAYFMLILIGSVQLGWHYAIDGIAGGLGAIVAFWVSGAYFRRAASSSSPGSRIAAAV